MTAPVAQLTIDVELPVEERAALLAADARRGLTAKSKSISPVWFYDAHGSALFDEITRLPEYYLTRAERSLLDAQAGEIAERTNADTLVELGSGTCEKTRILLDALRRTGSLRRYVPLDVDQQTLAAAAAGLAADYPGLEIHGVVGDFQRHLAALPSGGRRLVAFLGSTIGNLTPPERAHFLKVLADTLAVDDRFLLGVDLVKDPARLRAAYDDPRGLTAAFNVNALRVLNHELDADFDPHCFTHVAVWDAIEQWMEMRLRATVEHTVHVRALDLEVHFDAGEEMRTEISAKFTPERIATELDRAGLVIDQSWEAPEGYLLLLGRRTG